ncbi:AAA family ATPase, partial [Angustibacter peucedani]
ARHAAVLVGADPAPAPGLADPRDALPRPTRAADLPSSGDLDPTSGPDGVGGRVVTVWGTPGAPGRTTVAVGLAAELSAAGRSTLLVDADTTAASVAQQLGLLDEASGLVSACRAADRGALDPAALAQLAPLVADRWRVLTGLARAARWPEVRGGALATVLGAARCVAAWTVVDVGARLERDEELAFDVAAPRRHAATLTALAESDVVVAVGSAGPVGLQRLVRGLQELAEVTDVTPVVVVNRVRASAVGPRPARRVREALERYAGVDDPVLLPDDAPALDAALLVGRSLVEHARTSPVRQGLLDLVGRLDRAAALPPRPDAALAGAG